MQYAALNLDLHFRNRPVLIDSGAMVGTRYDTAFKILEQRLASR